MTFTTTFGKVTIITHLYGEITEERIEREKLAQIHRAKQLDDGNAR